MSIFFCRVGVFAPEPGLPAARDAYIADQIDLAEFEERVGEIIDGCTCMTAHLPAYHALGCPFAAKAGTIGTPPG
jgi:hypothetical protein